ncbi:hypothetical protein GBA52_026871 [Prunus armeniaca]|nr:hypothetical protein GBA52_026871 [Prunus armeniaca]
MRNVRRWVHEAWAPNGYKLVYGCRNKDTSVFESTFYCSAATAALAAYDYTKLGKEHRKPEHLWQTVDSQMQICEVGIINNF